MQDNMQLKRSAWQRVRLNWAVVFKLTWPLIAWQFLSAWFSYGSGFKGQHTFTLANIMYMLSESLWSGLVEAVLVGVISLGTVYALIEWVRTEKVPEQPEKQGFKYFKRETVRDAVVLMGLRFLYTILWGILLFIPGVIKAIAYSQAEFLYADDVKQGKTIESMGEYLSRSQALMDGHKVQYFWLQVQFIPWWILAAITFGLASFWILPYYETVMAEFYLSLRNEQ